MDLDFEIQDEFGPNSNSSHFKLNKEFGFGPSNPNPNPNLMPSKQTFPFII